MLVGRDEQQARIDRLIADARSGRSGSLVIRGEPGIGKSALLDHAAERARDLRVLRTVGVESESALPFSALHELVLPIIGEVEALPEPQRVALRGAFALAPAAGLVPFAVHAATLGLLAAAAERGPLVCLVDDTHWLDTDSAEALAFTCRRLGAEGILMLFAERTGAPRTFEATGVPELRLEPLDRAASLALLERTHAALTAEHTERVVQFARGNPLGLLEIPRALRAAQAEGREVSDEPLPVGERVERSFLQRASSLSEGARWALLLAAAEDSARVERVSAVAGLAALEEAESSGLVAIDSDRITFRHPLVRSSIYHAAAPARRRAAHAALAEVADDQASRAWHLAGATLGPREETARALEDAGTAALARGAPSVASAAFERAARVSPDAEARARRLYAAGEASWLAGRPSSAGRLLDDALPLTADAALRADIQASRARVIMWTSSVTGAYDLLIEGSRRVASVDRGRSALLMASAAMPALMAGRLREALAAATEASEIARTVPAFPVAVVDTLRAGSLLLTGNDLEAKPLMSAALALLRSGQLTGTEESVTSLGQDHMWVGEYDAARAVFEHVIDAARREGSFRGLPFALAGRADLDTRVGRLHEAYVGALGSLEIGSAIDQESGLAYTLAILARVEAMLGREADCRAHVDRALKIARTNGARSVETYAGSALGLLELGLGRIAEAIGALETVSRFADEQGLSLVNVIQWVPDLVEAYVYAGRTDDAARTLARFERQAHAVGNSWAIATGARCRGLLASDDEFAAAFENALVLHRGHPSPYERARTDLVFGERLRRARSRVRARAHLRAALETFERLGAEPWASRARAELSATGETVRRRPRGEELTPRELHVALLVAEGKTNRETATALFLSEKTIEHHLHNVFTKLGVRSRTELVRRIVAEPPLPSAASPRQRKLARAPSKAV